MTTGAAESAATPEVAAYLAQKEVAEKSAQVTWRRVALFLGVTLLFVLGVLIYFAVTVGMIRSTQVQDSNTLNGHTATLTETAKCQEDSFNAILKDARLAFTGDHNPADYAKAPKSC